MIGKHSRTKRDITVKEKRMRVAAVLVIVAVIALSIFAEALLLDSINAKNTNKTEMLILTQMEEFFESNSEAEIEEIQLAISNIPAYEGFVIHANRISDGIIVADTNTDLLGEAFDVLGIPQKEIELAMTRLRRIDVNGFRYSVRAEQFGNFMVIVTYSTQTHLESFITISGLTLGLMLIAGIIIFIILNKLIIANAQRDAQLSILLSMSEIYYNMHLIDLRNNTFVEYRATDKIKELHDDDRDALGSIKTVMESRTDEAYREKVLDFVDLTTVADRLKGKKMISMEYITLSDRWYEAAFVSIEKDALDTPIKVIFSNRCIDDVKAKEERLIIRSNTDELTGFYNRRAYEEDINIVEDTASAENFIYISLDVNGLKVTNDTLGHAAGDELIVGACECMRKCFGQYGKLYRTGGDEFAIIMHADDKLFDEIRNRFDETVAEWSGELVSSLAVSYGVVKYDENEEKSIRKIAILADKRMYESKSAYYRKKGVDRRGQRDAHIALCNSYTKILKINITEDTYQVLNMPEDEKNEDKGFCESLSKWIYECGQTGMVHPEDLESYLSKTNPAYLSDYFTRKKDTLRIFYRRKIAGEYKKAMLEIMPADDYSDACQKLYVYVKNIDA